MIQDIRPKKYDNHYQEQLPKMKSIILLFHKDEVLCKLNKTYIEYPIYEQVKDNIMDSTYLFAIDNQQFFLGKIEDENKIPEGFVWEKIDIFRKVELGYTAFAGITAYQLCNWYEENKRCGRCGEILVHSHNERMLQCPSCKKVLYPQICPAVIVAVTHHNKLLLTKYAQGNYKRYALVAGFTEIGETIEETVEREVMEEVGLKVKNITYYKSQPWSFTGTLLFGFFAELDGSDEIKMDQEELAVAEWVERENVPFSDKEISLTREMMTAFHEGRY